MSDHMDRLTITATPSRGLVIRQGDKVAQWQDKDAIWQVMQWGVGGYPVGDFRLTERQRLILAREAANLLLE